MMYKSRHRRKRVKNNTNTPQNDSASCSCMALLFMLHIIFLIFTYSSKTSKYLKVNKQVRRNTGNENENETETRFIEVNPADRNEARYMEIKQQARGDTIHEAQHLELNRKFSRDTENESKDVELNQQVRRNTKNEGKYAEVNQHVRSNIEEKVKQSKDYNLSELRIATFGTSRTWGATLINRTDAYPYLLSSKVKNFAILGSDARYPSICTQSMVSDSIYDVIVVEYDRIGRGLIECVETLLKRLRQRYPDATIILTNMWLLWDVDVITSEKSRVKLPSWVISNGLKNDLSSKIIDFAKNSSAVFDFSTSYQGRKIVSEKFAQKYNLKIYSGLSDIEHYRSSIYTANMLDFHLKYFSDFLHWNGDGHSKMATDIKKIIKDADSKRSDSLGTWNETDLCSLWIESGVVEGANKIKIPPEVIMTNYDIPKGKYALEFPSDVETTIQLENPSKVPQRLYLTYMASYPNRIYPKMKVTVKGSRSEEKLDFYIDPFEDHGYPAHFPVLGGVGLLDPGNNFIQFKPMDSSVQFHFRLVGISVSEVSLLKPGLTYSWL